MDLNCLFETTNYEYEYVDKMIDAGIQEEWEDFLKENSEDLNEEALDEGKILNKIRWKLALFSLRFLKETSINDFFIAYYADKKGNPTKEGVEFCKRKKKEKIKRMRELANNLSEETKNKIINSQVAKEAEKRGAVAFASAGISGAAAGLSGYQSAKVKADKNNLKNVDKNDTDVTLKTSSDFITTIKGDGREAVGVKHTGDNKGNAFTYTNISFPNGDDGFGVMINRNDKSTGHGSVSYRKY